MKTQITNVTELRALFWDSFPELVCKKNRNGNPLRQNEQPCTTRCVWVDFVDSMHRDGHISDKLAQRATL